MVLRRLILPRLADSVPFVRLQLNPPIGAILRLCGLDCIATSATLGERDARCSTQLHGKLWANGQHCPDPIANAPVMTPTGMELSQFSDTVRTQMTSVRMEKDSPARGNRRDAVDDAHEAYMSRGDSRRLGCFHA